MKDKIENLKKSAQKFPKLPGVYLMKKTEDQILYIGKAKMLRNRVLSYFNKHRSSLKTAFLISQVENLDYIVTENEIEAYLLESSLIKKYKPRYNIRLKDDKAYPYIRLSIYDNFPRFYFERRVKEDKSFYFGPYTESWMVRSLLDFLNQHFYLRDCSNSEFKSRKRPCLSWDMGICLAPCVKKISEKDYKKNYKKALKFLNGNFKNLKKDLKHKMNFYSKKLQFEEANRLKNRYKAIDIIDQSQVVLKDSQKDQDVVAFKEGKEGFLIEILHFRKGRLIGNRFHFFKTKQTEEEFLLSFLNQYYSENLIPDEFLIKLPIKVSKLKLLEKVLSFRKKADCKIFSVFVKHHLPLINMAEKNAENHFRSEVKKESSIQDVLLEIQKRLQLINLPVKMECYDVSHWRGRQCVGSQVVFENGLPCKKKYRIYHLKKTYKGDDYLALKELIFRRLKHVEYELPDMILIDGGRGQLKAVQEVLKSFKKVELPLVSLAKDRIKQTSFYESPWFSSGERFYLLDKKQAVTFPSNSKALQTLLHLRNEAHRFALKSHRRKREKEFLN